MKLENGTILEVGKKRYCVIDEELFEIKDGAPPIGKVKIEMTFVPHGYEADFYVDGKPAGCSVRDFSKNHNPSKTKIDFILYFEEFLDQFRKEFDKNDNEKNS
jgi:hypothetical protein